MSYVIIRNQVATATAFLDAVNKHPTTDCIIHKSLWRPISSSGRWRAFLSQEAMAQPRPHAYLAPLEMDRTASRH